MLKAPTPPNEEARHLDLLNYDILDSEEDHDFNDLIELAAQVSNCPVALISFIDTDRQWFKAKKNVKEKQKSREASFCGHAILQDGIMVIKDAGKDPRFSDNPDVAGGLNIQFYAGAPIFSSTGNKLGTVCVIDNHPRTNFYEEQSRALKIISTQVTRLLELRLKNRIIMQQARELSAKERKLSKSNTIIRERENDYIAYQLHENIAQVLAVAKMKLEISAAQGKATPELMRQVKDYLSLTINDVKKLSRSITPTTFKAADYTVHIKNVIEEYNSSGEIFINFSNSGNSLQLNATLGLTIFRMIEYLLAYAKLADASEASIDLNTIDNTLLAFRHNGGTDLSKSEEANIILNNLSTRADIIQATYVNNVAEKKMEIILSEPSLT